MRVNLPEYCISIHAPRAGSDSALTGDSPRPMYFNPRSPCGERLALSTVKRYHSHFNPRSPCGERRLPTRQPFSFCRYFNPRSPCGERRVDLFFELDLDNFNPRSPCGERRYRLTHSHKRETISIHAPRAGSDKSFNSQIYIPDRFQSTLPVRGATGLSLATRRRYQISIHAPRAGSDADARTFQPVFNVFQSTLPVRGATTS